VVDHVRESQRAVASCANESQDAVDAIGDRRKTDSFRELDLSNAFCHPDVPLLNAFLPDACYRRLGAPMSSWSASEPA
jgi:hypothetical protein